MGRLRFRILGPLEVEHDGEELPVGGQKVRCLLALLLLRAGDRVSVESLSEALWGDERPATARTALQVHISGLRRVLAADPDVRIETLPGAYRLRVPPGSVDATRFRALSETGRRQAADSAWQQAAASLGEAVSLWRGSPALDVEMSSIPVEAIELEESYLATVESWAEAMLALGRHEETIELLERLRPRHPLRDRLHSLAALALYRCGRQGEALECLGELRRQLSSELGIEPGAGVQELERQILSRDPALDPPGTEPQVVREGRKAVVALVCRLPGDGSGDPEAGRVPAEGEIGVARDSIERREGSVLLASGRKLVGLFGVPRSHEDDASRAVEAALELRATFDASRVGIASGEALVESTGDEETVTSVRAVDDADELSDSARPSEILLTGATLALAGNVVGERTEVLLLREDRSPRTVYKLTETLEERSRRTSPLVGRVEEIEVLRSAFERVRKSGVSTVTVLGPAGVGKSRLVSAFLADIRDAPVLLGRCLSYGGDITLWPLAEMIRDASGIRVSDSPGAARRKVRRIVEGLPDADFIAEQVGSVLGLSSERPVADEMAWAIRKFLEAKTRRRPTVMVFEDLHWAEPGLLDLIEQLGSSCDRTLIVCTARQELLETRSRWGGGRDSSNLVLRPLDREESEQLLVNLLDGQELPEGIRELVLRTAEGHPLFIEELLSMLIDEGMLQMEGGRWEAVSDIRSIPTPPSVQSLLAARLDRLPPAERLVLEHAAVVGRDFTIADLDAFPALAALDVGRALESLVDKDFLRPDRDAHGERTFRFHHLLMRDAAYDGMSKLNRAFAHEAFAAVLEQRTGERLVEVEEIVGYHLEAAERYRRETGLPENTRSPLAVRAARHLAAAGGRAFDRDDMPAAAGLLGRALALLPDDARGRAFLGWQRGISLFEIGRLEEAERVITDALVVADAHEDVPTAWRLRMELAELRSWRDLTEDSSVMREIGEAAASALEEIGDLAGVARAHRLIGDAYASRGRLEEAIQHFERARAAAAKARDERELHQKPNFGVVHSPISAPRCLEIVRENLSRARRPDPDGLAGLGFLLAMLNERADAERVFDEAHERAREIGGAWKAANVGMYHGAALLTLDDAKAAEEVLRPTIEALQSMGERRMFSTAVALLAEALFRQGDYEQAMLATMLSEDATASDDLASQMAWMSVRAKILAVRGETDAAGELAGRAVAVAEQTDLVNMIADVHLDHAFVLGQMGRSEEAARAAQRALELYRRKGNIASAERASAILDGVANPA